MAEGHAVVRWANELRALAGEVVLSAQVTPRWRDRAAALPGSVVHEIRTAGKHLLLDVGDTVIHCHAMQYGSWQVGERGMELRKERRYVRLHLVTAEHEAVYYHGPVMEVLTREEAARHPVLLALGPDVLGATFDVAEVARRLAREGERQLGDAILDQRVVAGIGNIYKSEGLFLAHLDPRRPADGVSPDELGDLWEVLIPLMRGGVERPGRITTLPDELARPGEYTWVYRRRGRECFRCGSTVAMLRQGELARATYYCPDCQA